MFYKKALCCYENIVSSDVTLFLTTTSLLGICSELWMPDVGKLVNVYSSCRQLLTGVYTLVVNDHMLECLRARVSE